MEAEVLVSVLKMVALLTIGFRQSPAPVPVCCDETRATDGPVQDTVRPGR